MPIITTIGIDPALTNIGICVLHAHPDGKRTYETYLIKPPSKLRSNDRIHFISMNFTALTKRWHTGITTCVEGYAYGGHNLAQLGEAYGIIKALCLAAGHHLIIAAPTAVKKFATGNHRADKNEIMARYRMSNEHLADARAMAEIAYVYVTGESKVRHELEVVHAIRNPKIKKPNRPKDLAKAPVRM